MFPLKLLFPLPHLLQVPSSIAAHPFALQYVLESQLEILVAQSVQNRVEGTVQVAEPVAHVPRI